mmetsp:Transcript_90670/g.163650  ORF Transcript_90670/g.163650 Transcript_90670/m.163650 type:complete len:441 (-) Transcript_90670:29-1351(-)
MDCRHVPDPDPTASIISPAVPRDSATAIAFACIALGCNFWVHRAYILQLVGNVWMQILAAELSVGAGRQEFQSRKTTGEEKKRKAQEEYARLKISQIGLRSAQGFTMAILTLRLFLSTVFGILSESTFYYLPLALLVFHVMDRVPLTTFSCDACLVGASLAWTVAIALSEITPVHMVQLSSRTVWRVILSLGFCNPKVSLLCSAVFSAMHVHKLYNFASSDPYFSSAKDSLLVSELAVFCNIGLVVVTCNGCIKESVHARLQVLVAQSCERSSRRLLSVLCEAVVTLGPDLRIAGSCQNLCHMLMAGFGSRGKGLTGALFTSFLAPGDRQRFEDFIHGWRQIDDTLSDCSGTSTKYRPPGSLQVHLRDAGGLLFPVDLFHVINPNSDDTSAPTSHLIGIKEEQGPQRGQELTTSSVFSDIAPSSSPSVSGIKANNNSNNN